MTSTKKDSNPITNNPTTNPLYYEEVNSIIIHDPPVSGSSSAVSAPLLFTSSSSKDDNNSSSFPEDSQNKTCSSPTSTRKSTRKSTVENDVADEDYKDYKDYTTDEYCDNDKQEVPRLSPTHLPHPPLLFPLLNAQKITTTRIPVPQDLIEYVFGNENKNGNSADGSAGTTPPSRSLEDNTSCNSRNSRNSNSNNSNNYETRKTHMVISSYENEPCMNGGEVSPGIYGVDDTRAAAATTSWSSL